MTYTAKKPLLTLLLPLCILIGACDRQTPAKVKNCPSDKPYYALCTHNKHAGMTWLGQCSESWEQALQASEKHVSQQHPGEKRWTGVKKIR